MGIDGLPNVIWRHHIVNWKSDFRKSLLPNNRHIHFYRIVARHYGIHRPICRLVLFASKGDPGKTSAFLFLAPFFGVLSGWLILDETINWYVTIGGLCIFTGIFLVNWTSSRKMEAGSLETSLNK